MIDIGISIKSNPFNDKWPKVKIYFNNELIDTIVCENVTNLNYHVQESDHNLLSIELVDKNFGDNGLWDVSPDGQGLESTITDIKLNDVSIEHLLSLTKFKTNWTPAQAGYLEQDFVDAYSEYFSNGMLTFNGVLTFEFLSPVYDFLIEKKYKVPHTPELAFHSNKTELFHYESGLAIISDIEKIILQHNV